MEFYIFNSDEYCWGCGVELRDNLLVDHPEYENMAESAYDSNDFPKGPYGGYGDSYEADSPQHCFACGKFLYNLLTDEGYAWLIELLSHEGELTSVEQEWYDYYGRDMVACADGGYVEIYKVLGREKE